jgi:hypothetical protein
MYISSASHSNPMFFLFLSFGNPMFRKNKGVQEASLTVCQFLQQFDEGLSNF